MDEAVVRRRKQELQGAPIVCSFLGSAKAGKTTLAERLVKDLRGLGISPITHVDQDSDDETDLANLAFQGNRRQLQAMGGNISRTEVSDLYLTTLKFHGERIKRMKGTVLWQHGPHFTVAMEKALGRNEISIANLRKRLPEVPMGHFGIFLDISPRELLRAGRSCRILGNLTIANAAYSEMLKMVERDKKNFWIHIDARQDKETVAQIALREFCARYRPFLEVFNKLQFFEFPGGEKVHRGGA